MDDKKIAFIVQDGAGAHDARQYLTALSVPEGYEIEVLGVGVRGSAAAAYQCAMQQSDAKYKVYLTAGTVIVNPSFIASMLALFQADAQIGLVGLVGTEQLSASGLFARSPHIKGKMLFWDGTHFVGEHFSGASVDVMAVSRELIATQYDIPWRSDLFHQDAFWAEAQCAEFRRRGYRCAVPCQAEDWAIVEGMPPTEDEDGRKRFLAEYARDCYPLVSIIIPTYQRPKYFREALESVLAQTYRNLDIFITDNSHNTETADMMRRDFSGDPRIHYEHHPDYGAGENWTRACAYDNPKAEYVNWLMDDDLFLPEKIETMADYFFANPGISLVTSYRECVDSEGRKLPDLPYTKPFVHAVTRISSADMGGYILRRNVNVVGEPTTPLVRKEFLLNGHALGWTGREGRYLISDFPTWLNLLSQGDAIYIPTPLSRFRKHDSNDQWNPKVRSAGYICMAMMIREAIERGVFLLDDAAKQEAIASWFSIVSDFLKELKSLDELGDWQEAQNLLQVIAAMAAALANGYHIAFDIDVTPHDTRPSAQVV